MTGMRSSAELLAAAYAAFNSRDIDAVLALMHPDVDWPNGMDGGRVLGRPAVREYWERQWKIIDPHVEPLRIEDLPAGHTVVDVRQLIRDLQGNVLADRMVQHIYHIEGGLIRRMDIETPAAPPASGSRD